MTSSTMQERESAITWRGTPVTLLGTEVKAGDRAPDFSLRTVDMKPFTLSDAIAGGTRAAMFVVVPSIDTGVCSKETHTFNERASELPADKIGLFTVSMDLPFAQKRWCGAEGVDRMTMLSDFYDHSFGFAYGVREKGRGLLVRSIFIVGKDGVVKDAIFVPEVTTEPDYDAVLAAAKRAAI